MILIFFLYVFIAVMRSKRMKLILEMCAFLTVQIHRVSLMKKVLLGKEKGPPQERKVFPRGI